MAVNPVNILSRKAVSRQQLKLTFRKRTLPGTLVTWVQSALAGPDEIHLDDMTNFSTVRYSEKENSSSIGLV